MTHVSNATFMPVDSDDLDQHLCGYVQLSTTEKTKQLRRCTSWADWAGGADHASIPYCDLASWSLEAAFGDASIDEHTWVEYFVKAPAVARIFEAVFDRMEKQPYEDEGAPARACPEHARAGRALAAPGGL